MEYPSIYSFPPFFTKQPNNDTWSKQLEMWQELLLSFVKYHKQFHISTDPKQLPFNNPEIQRSLSSETIVLILESLVKQNRGAWEGKSKQKCYLYWHTLEEWADLIYKWVFDSGKNGTVCTLYEIIHGEECIDQGIVY
jgi:ESCRT-II complex subunit VPS25